MAKIKFKNIATTIESLLSNSATVVREWVFPDKDMTVAGTDDVAVATAAAGTAQSDIDTHEANTSNPHSVTKTQVGLGNVDNTTDAGKPVSTATQTALDLKANLTVVISSITGATSLDGTAFGKIFNCSGTTADYTVDLPTAVGNSGYAITFKGASTLTKVVTIDANGTQTINGLLTRAFSAGGGFTLMSDGSNWDIIHEIPSIIRYTPTLVGWAATPTVAAYYTLCGKMLQLHLYADGTSNSTTTSYTLPPNLNSGTGSWYTSKGNNNGAAVTLFMEMVTNTAVVGCYTTTGGAAWTASGTKTLLFTITYMIYTP